MATHKLEPQKANAARWEIIEKKICSRESHALWNEPKRNSPGFCWEGGAYGGGLGDLITGPSYQRFQN